MATQVSTPASQPSSPLATLVGLSKGELEEAVEGEGEDFLSLMLASLDEKDVKASKNPLLDKILIQDEKAPLEVLPLDEELEALQLEEATFIQILQLLEHLNGGKEVKVFHKIDDKLKALFKDATILGEFKGAKDVKDLMELSKKYDLGLEKISITKSDLKVLKETFPLLEKKGFFKDVKTSFSSHELLSRAAKKVDLKAPKEKSEKPNPTQTLTSLLNSISKDKTDVKENTKVKVKEQIQVNVSDVELEENQDEKTDKKKTASKIKHAKQEHDAKDVKKEFLNPFVDKKDKDVASMQTAQKVASSELNKEQTQIRKDDAKMPSAKTQEAKTQNLQSSLSENSSESKSESGEQKHEQNSSSFTKEIGKADNLNVKSSNFKHTLNTFARDFKEKMDEYKAPLMKVKMALNPRALGEMDVTIVNRGSNLHVSINSNTTAMNLFLQNQMEFKNALVNMGFTNLQMNFSNQKQNQEQHQQNKSGTGFASGNEEDDEMANENTILEIVVPDYA